MEKFVNTPIQQPEVTETSKHANADDDFDRESNT